VTSFLPPPLFCEHPSAGRDWHVGVWNPDKQVSCLRPSREIRLYVWNSESYRASLRSVSQHPMLHA
jgi:hypothetical protein